MSDRGGSRLGRYLTSRKNTAGLAAACLGPLAGLAGVVDLAGVPVIAVGGYAVLALLVPNRRADPEPAPPRLDQQLRDEVQALRGTADRAELPARVPQALHRILDVLDQVLVRLGEPAERTEDRVEQPRRLADAATMIRDVLPRCLQVYAERSPRTPQREAAAELVNQLGVVGAAADRLAAEIRDIPDAGALRAKALTDELLRMYPPQPKPRG